MSEWSNHAVKLSHRFLTHAVSFGDNVCDATAGNGKDTKFLAELVGGTGKVFAVDIQKSALETTEEILKKSGLIDRVELFCNDHAELKSFIRVPLKAVTFNLGYLPGGDHSLVTAPVKTIAAIRHALDLLVPGGLLSIVAYLRHPGGQEETSEVGKFLRDLSQREWDVLHCHYPNQQNDPPQLFIVRRREMDG